MAALLTYGHWDEVTFALDTHCVLAHSMWTRSVLHDLIQDNNTRNYIIETGRINVPEALRVLVDLLLSLSLVLADIAYVTVKVSMAFG